MKAYVHQRGDTPGIGDCGYPETPVAGSPPITCPACLKLLNERVQRNEQLAQIRDGLRKRRKAKRRLRRAEKALAGLLGGAGG